jgi:hypothetical protein
MSPESLKLFQEHGAIPGMAGYFKAIVHDGHHFAGNLDFRQVSLAAEQAASVQLAMATLALRSAIKGVEKAVQRVEGKVDRLVALANAEMVAGVVGHHGVLAEYVDRMDRTGALPAVDWDSVATLGPELGKGVEQLRRFAVNIVQSLDGATDAHERSEQLRQAVGDNRLGEVLQLLVVAEDSLYLWQRLRIQRAATSDPEHLEHITTSAKDQLAGDLKADADLNEALRRMLTEYSVLRPLEVHRRWSRTRLERQLRELQADLDEFVEARRIQIAAWPDITQPTLRDAGQELQRRAIEAGHAAQDAGVSVVEFSTKQARRAQRAVVDGVRKLGR